MKKKVVQVMKKMKIMMNKNLLKLRFKFKKNNK